jgi:hypothetical protein
MSFGGRMSRAESAGLLRFSPAHGAADGQYVPHRELRDFHTSIIQHREFKNWSILLLNDCNRPNWESATGEHFWQLELDREIGLSLKDHYFGFPAAG